MTKFNTLNNRQLASLIGSVGKTGTKYLDNVQSAIQQVVFQALAYGNTAYADRLISNLITRDQARVRNYIVSHSNMLVITDKERETAILNGKPIADNRVFKIAKGQAPKNDTPEAKQENENTASVHVQGLPFWSDWKRPTIKSDKPYNFNTAFGRLLSNSSEKTIDESEQDSVKAFQSFAGLIQSGITLEQLRSEIIAEYTANQKPKRTKTSKVKMTA